MACCFFPVKPIPEPLLPLYPLNPYRQTSMKFKSKYSSFLSRKCILKCRLPDVGHFVSASVGWACGWLAAVWLCWLATRGGGSVGQQGEKLGKLLSAEEWIRLFRSFLDSFTVPCTALTAGICLPLGLCKGIVTGVWKNGGNSHWSREPIMQWGTRQSLFIFRPTNHKSMMPANWRPVLIPHWQSYCHQARTV